MECSHVAALKPRALYIKVTRHTLWCFGYGERVWKKTLKPSGAECLGDGARSVPKQKCLNSICMQ